MTHKHSIEIESNALINIAVHPGGILKEELAARSLSANALALKMRVPSGRITDILNEKRGISVDTALRLDSCLGIRAGLWLDLQTSYDLAAAERSYGSRIKQEVARA